VKTLNENKSVEYKYMEKNLATLGSTFFLWGLITAINSTLVLFFYHYFNLSWPQAMLINVLFYVAPFVTCLPCSSLIASLGYRYVLRASLSLVMGGCLLLSYALSQYFLSLSMCAVFVIATGVAALQVVANPYLTLLSKEHKRVGNLSLASAVNSLGTTLAPLCIAFALQYSPIDYVSHKEPIRWIWLGLAIFSGMLIMITFLIKIPDVMQPKSIERKFVQLWQNKGFVFSACAIFTYVGVEVTLGTNTISYLTSIGQWDAEVAISLISFYWGGALIGRFLFGFLAHKVSLRKAFFTVTITSALLVFLAIVLNNTIGGYLLLLIGFANSIMYPIIFSHSMKTVPQLANLAAGILIMAGVGGAVVPYLQAMLVEIIALRFSFLLPFALYLLLACWGAKYLDSQSPSATGG
jgi:FHS family L-fucose permease-like MFS transporter